MDAIKFIKERNRMCKSFDAGCKGCPAFDAFDDRTCCAVGQESTMDAKDQIAMVEEWSTANPRKTRQSMFLEQWPEAQVGDDGVLSICPSTISSAHRNKYGGCANYGVSCTVCCREFWMHEVK